MPSNHSDFALKRGARSIRDATVICSSGGAMVGGTIGEIDELHQELRFGVFGVWGAAQENPLFPFPSLQTVR
jgi:hypothetical protein